jgi:hypothetical protein
MLSISIVLLARGSLIITGNILLIIAVSFFAINTYEVLLGNQFDEYKVDESDVFLDYQQDSQ